MLLPKNIERCQWVNKYYRIKVLFNVAEFNSKPHSAKAQRINNNMLFILTSFFGALFLLYELHFCIFIIKCIKNLINYKSKESDKFNGRCPAL